MSAYRKAPPMTDDTESRYRSAIAELCTMLASEKLPGADGAAVVGAAIQIATGMCERFGLPDEAG